MGSSFYFLFIFFSAQSHHTSFNVQTSSMPVSHVTFRVWFFQKCLLSVLNFQNNNVTWNKRRGPVLAEKMSIQVLIFYTARQGTAALKWPETITCRLNAWFEFLSEKEEDTRRERRRKASKQSQLEELFSGCSAEMRTRHHSGAFHSDADKENQMICTYLWQSVDRNYIQYIHWPISEHCCKENLLKELLLRVFLIAKLLDF